MKFQLTEEDINNGEQRSNGNCPIARSIRRVYPDKHINIGTDDFSIWDFKSKGVILKELPLAARQFIDNFDNGREVSPFEFELDIMPTLPSKKWYTRLWEKVTSVL